ncbi:hypothetical protein ATI61_107178 [Archangium gephyra]|uniref:Transcriptional regulator, LysR family n=1 Tax=Archangium gephyra TaxID=48 RepID=A0AAC8QHP6_9BACT|nr:hypothetical protein [Archangium gephyra]AKJ07729.1 Transcriptional regulator, LysR family [Archangium gephyra]REG29482.1 hypothetical protein ATI61_107178 [Archangium gephyra]
MQALELRLLQRSTHAMKLTEDGARCYERANELLTEFLNRGVCVASSWVLQEDILRGRLLHLVPRWQAAPLPVR